MAVCQTSETILCFSFWFLSVNFPTSFFLGFDLRVLLCIFSWLMLVFVFIIVRIFESSSDPLQSNTWCGYLLTNPALRRDWWTVFDDLIDFFVAFHSTRNLMMVTFLYAFSFIFYYYWFWMALDVNYDLYWRTSYFSFYFCLFFSFMTSSSCSLYRFCMAFRAFFWLDEILLKLRWNFT